MVVFGQEVPFLSCAKQSLLPLPFRSAGMLLEDKSVRRRRHAPPTSTLPKGRSRCRPASWTCERSTLVRRPMPRRRAEARALVSLTGESTPPTRTWLPTSTSLRRARSSTRHADGDPAELANGDCTNKAAIQDPAHHQAQREQERCCRGRLRGVPLARRHGRKLRRSPSPKTSASSSTRRPATAGQLAKATGNV